MANEFKEIEKDLQQEAGKINIVYYKSSLAFTQKLDPPGFDKNSATTRQEIKAVNLFSAFTADIIKEETLFIR